MSTLFNIIALFGIYGLYACGLTLVFGVLEVLNLAHAATFACSLLFAMYLATSQEWPLWASAVAAVAGGAMLGVLIDRIAFWPLRRRGTATIWGRHIGPLLSSLAVSTILVSVDQISFGLDPLHFPNDKVPEQSVTIGGASIQLVSLITAILFVVIVAALAVWMRRSRWGLEVRAVAERPSTAALFGVNSERRFVETMALAGMLAALAGLSYGLTFNIASPDTASQLDVIGFALVVLGGLGSIPGSLIGAAIIATIEILGTKWLPHGSETLVVFGVLFLLLIARPQGVLGRRAVAGAR